MTEPANSKRFWSLKLALLVLAVVAFVLVCTSIGRTGPLGFGPQKVEGAAVASSNADGTVIADSGGDRLLFINSSGKLVGVYGLDDGEAPITTATAIYQSGTDVFVAGVKRTEDGESITTEAVLRFNKDGDLLGTIWKKNYESKDTQVTPVISDVTADDKGNPILIKFSQEEMRSLHFFCTVTKVVPGNDNEEVLRGFVYPKDSLPFEIHYDPKSNRCALTDIVGELFVTKDGDEAAVPVSTGNRQLVIQSFDMQGDMAVMYDEKSQTLVRADNLFGDIQLKELDSSIRCNSVRISGDTVTTILDDGTVRMYDLQSGSSRDFTEASLITSFAARSIALSLSKAYLVVLSVVVIVRWLISSIRMGHRQQVRRAVVATAVSLICMAAILFHLFNLAGTSLESRQNIMSQIVSQASVTSTAELGDAATNAARRAMGELEYTDDTTDITTIVFNVEGILSSSFANSNGVQCNIYTVTKNGEVGYLFSNERDSVALGAARGDDITAAIKTVIQTANKYDGNDKGVGKAYYFAHNGEVQTVLRRNKDGNEVASCVAPLIAKDGTCITALEVSCRVESLLQSILNNVWGIMLAFIMTAASIYVISDELLRSGSAFLRYRGLKAQGVEWAETLLGRPLNFTLNFAFGMDTAFAVVIAKEMLTNSGLDSTAAVWGIPAFAISLGTVIGTLINAFLSTRVPGRSYALPMIMLGIASQLLCFYAVMNSWFVVFVGCKLVSSASFAAIQLMARTLAGSTAGKDLGDEHLSLVVNGSSVGIAGKGATVVAGVVGGAFAYMGNEWVYLAGTLATIAVVPILLLALPKGRVIAPHHERATLHNAFVFLRSPIMLATMAFAIFTTVLAGGYKSYILPLLLDSVGVSKTEISSLFALGNVILYGFTDTLITHRNAHGRWVMAWTALICLGVLFALFSFNQSPTWSVVAVIVITVLSWLAGGWKYTARGWAKRDYGFTFSQSQAMLDIEGSVVRNAQAPVLVALVALGPATCCLILGIFIAVCGVFYYLTTRKRGDFA